MQLRVDFARTLGPIKPVNGVNNGPICLGSVTDVSERYRDARIPYVRLHDTNWPHPYEIDIHTIFPDFSRDPDVPESYHFRHTDVYIASLAAVDARIVYRLGESIEHTPTKYFVHPPRDNDRWARICLGIIRHLNDGWADGHHFGIRHWEIWNEPDNPTRGCMWSGTDQQYFDLYAAAATAIKAYDPALQVGGFAATMVNDAFLLAFLRQCRDRHLPLDFFSWHTYTQDVAFLIDNAHKVKRWLEETGFGDARIHLNEWNYAPASLGIDGGSMQENTRDQFERQHGAPGMSFDAAAMIALLDAPVDIANYYDATAGSMWGLFDMFGVPHRSYYAFLAFGRLREGVRVVAEADALYAAASLLPGGATGRILVSNPTAEAHALRLDCDGHVAAAFLTDEERLWHDVARRKGEAMELPAYSLLLIEVAL